MIKKKLKTAKELIKVNNLKIGLIVKDELDLMKGIVLILICQNTLISFHLWQLPIS